MKTVDEIRNKIFCGDALKTMREFPTGSLDMCITSPPYYKQRTYNIGAEEIGQEVNVEDYIFDLGMVFGEVWRVLKPEGTLWVNIGDKYKNGELYLLPHRLVMRL